MWKTIVLSTFILIVNVGVFGQGPDQSNKQALVLQFRHLTGADRVEMSINVSTDDLRDELISIVAQDGELSAEQKQLLTQEANAAYERIDKAAKDFFADRDLLNKLSEEVIFQIYDSTFTEAELEQAIAFYRTPAGQKVASFLPNLSAQARQGFINAVIPKLQEFISPIRAEEQQKIRKRVAELKARP